MQFTQKSPKMANFAKNPKFAKNSYFENYWLNGMAKAIGEIRTTTDDLFFWFFGHVNQKSVRDNLNMRREFEKINKTSHLFCFVIAFYPAKLCITQPRKKNKSKCRRQPQPNFSYSHKNCRKWQISRKIRNLLKIHILKIIG